LIHEYGRTEEDLKMYRLRQPIMDRLIQVENENEMPRAEIHKIKRNNDNIYHYGDDCNLKEIFYL